MSIGLAWFFFVVSWLDLNKWVLLGLFWVTYNRKVLFESLFLQPIRGGNGATKPDELAKWTLTALTVVGFFRITEQTILGNVMGMLILGVAAIAGIQMYSKHFGSNYKSNDIIEEDSKKQDTPLGSDNSPDSNPLS